MVGLLNVQGYPRNREVFQVWYYAQGEQQIGPVDDNAFSDLVARGVVRPDTLVWREGMADWAAYGTLEQRVVPPPESLGSVVCVECGNRFPLEDTVEFEGNRICGLCKPLYFQRLREGHLDSGPFVYATILQRFLALLLDGVIVGASMAMLFFVLFLGVAGVVSGSSGNGGEPPVALMGGLMILGFFFATAATCFYFTWFVGKYGATPGKMALGIKIVRSDGTPVSYLRAFARMWALELSRMVFYIGFIIAFFDDQRRALHDHLCDTRVIVA